MAVTDTTPSSPDHLRLSLAAAMTLGWAPGLFYRDARLYCINLLLTYPEGCRARCAYCGLAAGRRECADGGRSFIRVQWPAFPLEDIVHRIAARRERIRRVCISMVTRRRAVADTAAVCRRLRAAVDLPVSLLITPTVLRPGDLEALRAAGADKVGVAVDLATPALFDRYRGGGVEGPHRGKSTGSATAERSRSSAAARPGSTSSSGWAKPNRRCAPRSSARTTWAGARTSSPSSRSRARRCRATRGRP